MGSTTVQEDSPTGKEAEPGAADKAHRANALAPEQVEKRVADYLEFVRTHLVEGEDYGIIPGTSPKPALFKPGADKLCLFYGLSTRIEVTHRIEDWDKGFLAYEVRVSLINRRNGVLEAEGIGSCNSRERKYKNQDAANVANTLLKMAEKRAKVSATISATRVSSIFSGDAEESDAGESAPRQSAPRPASSAPAPASSSSPAPSAQSATNGPLRGDSTTIKFQQDIRAGGKATCPHCKERVWDNRDKKNNPKAPDFKCSNKECLDDKGFVHGWWLPKDDDKAVPGASDATDGAESDKARALRNYTAARREAGLPDGKDYEDAEAWACADFLGHSEAQWPYKLKAAELDEITQGIKDGTFSYGLEADAEGLQEA
ncbi:MAG TPA: hypothetical protein VNM48_20690, partial [Chloroflexota bacterium]|nr:hypothetical protein [Chloroflexota bacterium]